MPASDILNPIPGWDPQFGDSMNPDYGFTRKRASTQLKKKAVGGTPWARETQNTGHTLTFSWLGRSYKCARRIKWYYEQYEDGFFTIIDHDGGGRHYVGRFTTEPNLVETANNKWDVQNVTFEEMPQAAMIQYPNDWVHDAVWQYALNDFGNPKLAVTGAWTQAQQNLGGIERTVFTDAGTIGDWATYEYRGYGFQLWMLTGPGQGIVNLFVNYAQVATIGLAAATQLAPQMVYQATNMPLDIYDVQIVQTAAVYNPPSPGIPEALQTWQAGAAPAGWAAPALPSGYTALAYPVSWYALKVMR